MIETMITRADLEALYDSLNIHPGSVVLLQADLAGIRRLIGKETMLIESLCSRIGPKGLLIVPTFTYGALDPACIPAFDESQEDGQSMSSEEAAMKDFADSCYDDWSILREEHPGFSSKTMPPDRWEAAGNALLLHTKMKRSEHPVYSFAWIGNSACPLNLQTLDFPLSFSHILKEMKKPSAINLLFNVDAADSLLFPLTARELEEDIVQVKKASVRRVKKTFSESFLHGECDRQAMISAMQKLEIVKRDVKGISVYKVTQKAQS